MKATISSIGFLANWRTRLVHFFFLPMVNMFLMVAINQEFFHSLFWNTAVASILMSGALLVVNSMAFSFTTDRNLGIDREMVAAGRFSFYYWGWKIAVSVVCALLLILINLSLLLFFGGREVPFILAISLIPQMIFSGAAVGFMAAILSWGDSDPYRISNFITSFGYVLSGTMVAISAYPPGLRILGWFFPFAHTLGKLHGSDTSIWYDALLSLLWLILGLALYKKRAAKVRAQAKFSTL